MESLGVSRFWEKKKILITGHTGFKGSWLCELLLALGARVIGFSLSDCKDSSPFNSLGLTDRVTHHLGDIRNLNSLSEVVNLYEPDFIFHFAAQSLVRVGYNSPIDTWTTNVVGTANLLEAVRMSGLKPTIIVATTDKVYADRGDNRPHCENDRMWGGDPYSASKVSTELVVDCWRKSYLEMLGAKVATVRAGNVIGGGDWSVDRIVPDLARAYMKGARLRVRNGNAIRPWQHVLDPLSGYLTLARNLSVGEDGIPGTSFNFGPNPNEQYNVNALVEEFSIGWKGDSYSDRSTSDGQEVMKLSISSDFARVKLGWTPTWDFKRSVFETSRWYQFVLDGNNPQTITRDQITSYLAEQ